jgi:hypothetical protein
LRQPFFERFGVNYLTATGGSTTTLVDTVNLKQDDNFWKGFYLYLPDRGTTRIVSGFTQSSSTITFLESTTAITSGTKYELWGIFSPIDIHNALNQALRDAWPYFFEDRQDYVVITSDFPTQVSPTFTLTPRWVYDVSLEIPGSCVSSVVTQRSGTNTYLIDGNRTFTSDDIGDEIRIYDGTAAGDRRTIISIVSPHVVQVNAAWSALPDTTSRYVQVDTAQSVYIPISHWESVPRNAPTTIIHSLSGSALAGRLMRISYEAEYSPLTTESSATTCPAEFLELSAISRLYLSRMSSSPYSEDNTWQGLQRAHAEAANSYALKYAFRHNTGSLHYSHADVLTNRPGYPF